jgi:hypothetical protein
MKATFKEAVTKVVPATVEVVSPATVTLELTPLEANMLGVIIGSTSRDGRNRLMKGYPYGRFNVEGGDAGEFGSELFDALAKICYK